MISRGWPFRLQPRGDELLSSLLARNAHAHGLNAQRFSSLFWRAQRIWGRDIDRNCDPVWIHEVAQHLGMSSERIAATTLTGVSKQIDPKRIRDRSDLPFVLSLGIIGRKPRRHAQQYCAICLKDETTRYFRREWRLAFVIRCSLHDCLMYDACLRCDAPIISSLTEPGALARCTNCHSSLSTTQKRESTASESALRLSDGLLSIIRKSPDRPVIGPWTSNSAFGGVRAILSLAASQTNEDQFRVALGLAQSTRCQGIETQFEHARMHQRASALELVGALLADWPATFRNVMARCRVTQRAFSRMELPLELQSEVDRLPIGHSRDRRWRPIISTSEMARLRRKDPDIYRTERAKRLLAACNGLCRSPRGTASISQTKALRIPSMSVL